MAWIDDEKFDNLTGITIEDVKNAYIQTERANVSLYSVSTMKLRQAVNAALLIKINQNLEKILEALQDK